MTTVQLKSKIQERLDKTENTLLLEAIYDMLNGSDDVVKFTPEQHARVLRGLEQMRKGQVTSHEDTMKELQEWLERK